VIDVAPTILEAAGLPEPTTVNGVLQSPIEGTSMIYTLNDAAAAERHDLQYFEMFGNRGIYHRGWSAVTKHKTPWLLVDPGMRAFDADVRELYDGATDYSQARDLAAEQPEMLAKLQRLWLIEATKYDVLPMDDRSGERLNPDLAGRRSSETAPNCSLPVWADCPRTAWSASRTSRSRSLPRSTSQTVARKA
jgi:arylsulfatase